MSGRRFAYATASGDRSSQYRNFFQVRDPQGTIVCTKSAPTAPLTASCTTMNHLYVPDGNPAVLAKSNSVVGPKSASGPENKRVGVVEKPAGPHQNRPNGLDRAKATR